MHLFDPEVASCQVELDSKGKLFCTGNLNTHAIDKFELHKCNSFCQLMDPSVFH